MGSCVTLYKEKALDIIKYCTEEENNIDDDDHDNEDFFKNESKENKINLIYKIKNKGEKIRLFGSKFYEKNKDNCKMVIDYLKEDLKEIYEPKKNEETLEVTLEIRKSVNDISHMFHGCSSLLAIPDFYNLNINNITNLSYIFADCSSLETLPDISNWNTRKVEDISFLFSGCSSLKYLPDISKWKTNKVVNMSHIFYGCSSLISIPDISEWNIKNVKDLSYLFSFCSSLKSFPDISKWKTDNAEDMSYLFYECSSLEKIPDISEWKTDNVVNIKSMFSLANSLKSLPDISKWNVKNVTDMSNLFYGCSSLDNLPNINNWSTDNITNISYIFCKCSNLTFLPDISQWKTNNVTDMSHIFHGCNKLNSIQDISTWVTNNVTDMSYMFYDCSSLKLIPFISKWNTNNVTNMSHMFYNCSSLTSLDDISKWNTDKVTDITMIFYKVPYLNPFPDISKWKCYTDKNIPLNYNDENRIEVNGFVENENLKFIPQIELKFNDVNQFDENLIIMIKNEIKNLIKTDNFSIVKFKKGSLTVAIALQFIVLREIKKNENVLSESFFNNINSEVQKFVDKCKDYDFASLGSTKPDYVDKEILDITNEENRNQLVRKMTGISENDLNNDINILEASKNIKMEDLEEFFNNMTLEADEQEENIKRYLKRAEKYNKLFDEEIEKALEKSVFEYNIIHTLAIDKEDSQYIVEKANCPNIITKILFHGTNINSVTGILASEFRKATIHIFGEGAYFTDILDYAWFYAGETKDNFTHIPRVGDTFTCVASEIFYDSTKKEKLINLVLRNPNSKVPKNGIRCAFANYETRLLGIDELEGYKGFIGNEYLITENSQILPLYGITFKRVEYLVIWRDINFDESNPNEYPANVFYEMTEFHRKIKKFIRRELNSKVYFINSNKEALELIERKKYNKVIIITNGSNNGEGFINQARSILHSKAIAAVTVYSVSAHIHWVKNMENVLILNGLDFHEKFFNCIKMNDKDLYNQLRGDIINYYSSDINEFDLKEATDDLFNFPNFKNSGGFEDLNFDLNQNSDFKRSESSPSIIGFEPIAATEINPILNNNVDFNLNINPDLRENEYLNLLPQENTKLLALNITESDDNISN